MAYPGLPTPASHCDSEVVEVMLGDRSGSYIFTNFGFFVISLTTCHSAKTLLLKRAKANDGVRVSTVSSPNLDEID